MNRYLATPLACVAMLALASCSNPAAPTVQPIPPAPVSSNPRISNTVAAVEIALTNAEKLALHYTALPRCGASAPPLCSDPATVQRIKDADNTAYNAVVKARSDEALIGVAFAAVSTFSALIPQGN